VIESALLATPISRISLRVRLALDRAPPDHILSELFTTTIDDIEFHAAYLPSRDTLIALVRRVKGNHFQLKTLRLVIDYSFIGIRDNNIPEDDHILEFEYREDGLDTSDDWPPLICDNKDLRSPDDNADAQTDASQFQFNVFSNVVRAGYQRLVHDNEVVQREGVEAFLNPPAAAAGIGNVGVDVAGGRD
jgi:hypothetical protein